MKKKVLAALLCAAMTGTMLAGCGGGGSSDDSGSGSTEEAAEGEEGEAEPEDVTTVGPDSGTKMEMWSFVSQHNDFYAKMLENGTSRILTDRFRSHLQHILLLICTTN